MDQRNLLTQALEFIKTQRQYRWWLRAVTGMAAVVVFVTTYLLILPAITMENSVLEVTATPSEAVLGEVIETEIFALADDGREETYFVLTADGDNAGLDESQLDFDSDGIASIEDTNGQVIDLHREYTEAGEARYWFVLQEGQSASFSLPWVNGMDRYRAEEVAEEVPVEPEEPPVEEEIPPTEEPSEGETPPDDTGMEETIPPESDTEPENPDGETPPAETAEPGTDAPPQDEPDADVPDTDTPDTEPGEPDTDSIETAPETPPAERPSEEPQESESAAVEENTTPSVEDTGSQETEPEQDSLASDSNASYAAASLSHIHYAGVSSVRTVGASTVSLSAHHVPLVAASPVTATDSDADKPSGEPGTPEPTEPEPTESGPVELDGGDEVPSAENGNDFDGDLEYETIYYTDIVLDQEGDPEREGAVTISFGCGRSLEAARKRAGDVLVLLWKPAEEVPEDEIPLEIPEDATSWATVEKEGFPASDSNGVMTLPSFLDAAGAAEPRDRDFSQNITQITVSTLQNGQWVPGTQFQDGDSVRVNIQYQIPAGTVGAGTQTIYYDLPDGITLAQEERGTVYDDSGVPVGSYTITTDGYIEIVFNSAFADDRAFTGQIQFQGSVFANADGSDNNINFGAAGTITVKPNPDPTDVRVEKTGSYDKTDKKLHYTLTVTTEKGTSGAITVSDAFGVTDTHATYDVGSFQIVKVDANGQETPVPGFTPTITDGGWDGAPEKFTIANLPALSAGESYRITYTATPDKTTSANGSSTVNNSVSVTTTGGDNSSGWNEVTIAQKMLSKWGNYDQAAGVIKWTITINPDKRDIGGWKLTDTVTQDGVTVTMPETVTLTGSNGVSQQIKLPYTFPAGSSDSYTITYETKVEGLEPGQTAIVYNKAEFEGDGEHYEGSSTVNPTVPGYGVTKSGWLDTNNSTETTGKVRWNASIAVPNALTGQTLNQITFTDTLHGAATGGKPVADSHYITGAQLEDMSVNVDGAALVRGTDYIICDADGQQITDFSEDAHYTGFQIQFQQSAVDKVKGKTISMQYYSTVDYTKLAGDVIYTIRNTGAIPDHESEGSVTYEKPSRLEKQASVTQQNGSYKDSGITVDYEASGGVLHYRLLLKTDAAMQGDITLTDLLPKGTKLVESSVRMAFYDNDYYEYGGINLSGGGTYQAADHIHAAVGAMNEDGTTPVTFTIDAGYNGDGQAHTLAVYYDVSIADDSIWTDDPGLESHIYRNEVTWGSESTGTDVTVERDVPELAKTGAQLPQLDANGEPMKDAQGNPVLSNTVRYYVTINQGAKDLDPVRDVLELKDVLTLPVNVAGADLNVGSVHLYHYDAEEENHCGQEINPARYSYVYDRDSHTLTFKLPDSMAMVLVYEYTIDRGSAAGSLNLSNSAQLTGVTGSETGNHVQFQETSSSATVTKRTLTIYKVDGDNYGKSLPGAKFQLERWENSAWSQVNTFTTDADGQIVLDTVGEDGTVVYQTDTLYKLTETAAPTGYAPDTTPRYFVWIGTQGIEATKAAMRPVLNAAGVSEDDVLFIANSSALYVPNTSTTLTVQKVWVDENGNELQNPGVDQVEVKLWQQQTETNAVTVTVNWEDLYGQSGTVSVQVKNGSRLTIDTGIYGQSYTCSINSGQETTYNSNSFTISVPGNTTISLKTPYQATIKFSNYELPTYVQTGEKKLYATITLSEADGWSYTWPSLPAEVNGKPVYYTVEETAIPGFHVTYSPNNTNGVQAGELVITNQSNGYVLPETGGSGTILYTAGGLALMALAGLMYKNLRRKEEDAS